MTTGASAHQDREDLFVADFYPQLREYLAAQHATGYDAGAGRARFLTWLSEHAHDDGDRPAGPAAAPGPLSDPVQDYLRQITNLPSMADQARTIRIPVHMVEVINKLARVRRQLLQDLGRDPTPDELAVELDMPPEEVIEVQNYGREPEPPASGEPPGPAAC